jgi:predicted N-acyltransferase
VELRIHHSVAEIPREAWNSLLSEDASPFVDWRFIDALEQSGCASPDADWVARHVTLWRGSELVAAMPVWIREGSDGDFSRDWGWADAAYRARIPYYPKLVVGVPFTPVTGRRLLIAPGESRAEMLSRLVDELKTLCKKQGAYSIHFLFPLLAEARELEAVGLTRRSDFQFHWHNDGYRDPEEFLARFDSKRRNQARRERAAPAEQGISIRTVRGDELAREPPKWASAAYTLHRSTIDKLMWGRGWLNLAFYEAVLKAMPEAIEIVAAEREGRLIAGAFNVATKTHLYGRYWGCLEDHRFLHFNVCLYHSIDECIRRGVLHFEGGAGGEHKIARGFEPTETYSSHFFVDPRLEQPLSAYIENERRERERALARWRAETPILKHRTVLKTR